MIIVYNIENNLTIENNQTINIQKSNFSTKLYQINYCFNNLIKFIIILCINN